MKFFQEGIFLWKKTIILVSIINFIVIVFIFLNLGKLPPVVPLYYGNAAGKQQLSPTNGLFIPPVFVLVFLLMNIIISKSYKDSFLDSLLVGSSIILTILSTITVVKIMLLVGNF